MNLLYFLLGLLCGFFGFVLYFDSIMQRMKEIGKDIKEREERNEKN